jgi:nucleolin
MLGATLRRAVVAVAARAVVRPRMVGMLSVPQHFRGSALAPLTSQIATRAASYGAGGPRDYESKGLSSKPDGCTTVFLANLPYSTTEEDIHQLCSDNGVDAPVRVNFLMDRDTGRPRGTGFVEFADTTDVDKFVTLNGAMLQDRSIRLDYATGERKTRGSGSRGSSGSRDPFSLSEKPEGCTSVFVGNLPYDIQDEDIYAKANEVGASNPQRIQWLTDRETGAFKGSGFIEFESTEDVDKFVQLNNTKLGNRSMRVDYAKGREKNDRY